MIVDILFIILGSLAMIILMLFSAINLAIPEGIPNALNYFINYFNYLRGIINIPVLADCALFLISFFSYWYGIKIILYLYSLIPFGKEHHQNLPKIK